MDYKKQITKYFEGLNFDVVNDIFNENKINLYVKIILSAKKYNNRS